VLEHGKPSIGEQRRVAVTWREMRPCVVLHWYQGGIPNAPCCIAVRAAGSEDSVVSAVEHTACEGTHVQ
jgi:hypothetical protein